MLDAKSGRLGRAFNRTMLPSLLLLWGIFGYVAASSHQRTLSIPNTGQMLIDTPIGQYLLEVSWPLYWNADCTSDNITAEDVPVIFILDGNAYFGIATDVARRIDQKSQKGAIIVGVGYPWSDTVTSDGTPSVFAAKRRVKDSTPLSEDGHTIPLTGRLNGTELSDYGGAGDFQHVFRNILIPALAKEFFPRLPLLETMPKVLFGHSYQGLFTLYSLFTSPSSVSSSSSASRLGPPIYDTYIVASPSAWFNDEDIFNYETSFFNQVEETQLVTNSTKVYFTFGMKENKNALNSTDPAVVNPDVMELYTQLHDSALFADVQVHTFANEDHGSSAAVAVQRGISVVLGA